MAVRAAAARGRQCALVPLASTRQLGRGCLCFTRPYRGVSTRAAANAATAATTATTAQWISHVVPHSPSSSAASPDSTRDDKFTLWLPDNEAAVFKPTPATMCALHAVTKLAKTGEWRNKRGIDWGTGTGILALALAKYGGARHVTGLDIEADNIACADYNATRFVQGSNGNSASHSISETPIAERRLTFIEADSFEPRSAAGTEHMEHIRRRAPVDFLVANPPADFGTPLEDDGFGFRRHILRRVADYVRPGGTVLLQWLSYYGVERALRLCKEEAPRVQYEGVAHASEWVPLWQPEEAAAAAAALGVGADAGCPAPLLVRQLEQYAEAEGRGALPYTCDGVTATETLRRVRESKGQAPLCQWQAHVFRVTEPT